MIAAGTRYISYPSRADWFTIWNLSDLHYGNKACAVDRLKEDVERIRRDPYSFWFGGGDYAEYISFRDRRFDAETITADLQIKDLGRLGRVLTERVRDILMPIRGKCLGLLYGNHENSYARENDQRDLHGWLCTELGAANLDYSAFVDVAFCRLGGTPRIHAERPVKEGGETTGYRFYLHHGAGCAVTPGGKLNRLIQFMHAFDADIYMIGHVHDKKGQRLVRMGVDRYCNKIVAKESLGIISGSYLKTYAQDVTSYGEIRGYSPTALCAAFVRVRPNTRDMKGEV